MMGVVQWWQRFWYGHEHEWVVYRYGNITLFGDVTGEYVLYRCTACGKFKEVKS